MPTSKNPGILKLKKKTCCCGAVVHYPCLCMLLGTECSSKYPLCACFKLLNKQARKFGKKPLVK